MEDKTMSKRLDILYDYISNDIPEWEYFGMISKNCFYYYCKVNALYVLDIIADVSMNTNEAEIVDHYYNHPKVSVYRYDSTVESTSEPFSGRKVYGNEFSGETYELFQDTMVRLHFNRINRTELEDILYIASNLKVEA